MLFESSTFGSMRSDIFEIVGSAVFFGEEVLTLVRSTWGAAGTFG